MNKIDISDELQVVRYHNGVKLLRPDHLTRRQSFCEEHRLGNLISLPFPVYLEDRAHISYRSNEETAQACGFISIKDFVGKSPFKYFKKDTILEKISNHQKVINANVFMITEENAMRKDGSILNTLSMRMPLYNDENAIVGLFGCSIVIGSNPLADSLTSISKLGLFNHIAYDNNKYIGAEIDSVYLSKRELECLWLTIKGRPAKQVAYDLKLSQRTVEEYLDNIKRKLKVSSKAALIEKGIEYYFFKLM